MHVGLIVIWRALMLSTTTGRRRPDAHARRSLCYLADRQTPTTLSQSPCDSAPQQRPTGIGTLLAGASAVSSALKHRLAAAVLIRPDCQRLERSQTATARPRHWLAADTRSSRDAHPQSMQ